MRQIWRLVSFFADLHRVQFTGQVEISWKDGVPQHTKTVTNRLPEELPGDVHGAVEILQAAQHESKVA